MKLYFREGMVYYMQRAEEGAEDETPTVRGHPVPLASSILLLHTEDFYITVPTHLPYFEDIVRALCE